MVPRLHFSPIEPFRSATTSHPLLKLPVPVYAIDDQTAIQVKDGNVEVISEGDWKLFSP